MKKFEIYKAGHRSFVAVAKANGNKTKAVSIANEHFKTRVERLDVTQGAIKGNTLFLDEDGAYWVVFRKESK